MLHMLHACASAGCTALVLSSPSLTMQVWCVPRRNVWYLRGHGRGPGSHIWKGQQRSMARSCIRSGRWAGAADHRVQETPIQVRGNGNHCRLLHMCEGVCEGDVTLSLSSHLAPKHDVHVPSNSNVPVTQPRRICAIAQPSTCPSPHLQPSPTLSPRPTLAHAHTIDKAPLYSLHIYSPPNHSS